MRGGLRGAVAALAAVLVLGAGSASLGAARIGVGAATGARLSVGATATTGSGTVGPGGAVSPEPAAARPPVLVSPRALTLPDAGATVVLPAGATFLLDLGGPPPDWQARVRDTSVLARVPNVLVVRGAQGVYRAMAAGVTALTAVASYPCQRAHPACEIDERAFRVVVVVSAAPPPSFSDVPRGSWAYGAVETLSAAGAIGGLPGGAFGPDLPVTRAQFVKMLDGTLGIAPAASGTGGFADVPAGSWFAPYVAAAVRAGLVQGESPATFGPGRPVTRQALAVWLARALKLTGGGTPAFSDAAGIAAWAAPSVAAAVRAGYLQGFPDGSFRPREPASRAQAAQVLAAVLRTRAAAGSAQHP